MNVTGRPEILTEHLKIILIAMGLVILGGTPARAERMAVTAPLANIRSGPGTGYEIMWKVERYYPLEVITHSGPWIHFKDFEDDRGWIHKSLVGRVHTVITRAPVSNIRNGPGTKYPILLTVEAGIPFKVLQRKGNWLHIQHSDGDRGWIHSSLLW
jgi:SH3-like domain-containing protein